MIHTCRHTGYITKGGREAIKYFTCHKNSSRLPFSRQGATFCDSFSEVIKHHSLLTEGKDKILKLYVQKSNYSFLNVN